MTLNLPHHEPQRDPTWMGCPAPVSPSRRGERMHRIMTVPQPTIARVSLMAGRLAGRAAGAGFVLALLLSLLSVRVQAQPTEGPPAPGITLSVNANERRKMVSGKQIAKVNSTCYVLRGEHAKAR